MKSPQRNRPLVYALYANAALLFAILMVMVSRGGTTVPSAQAAAPPIAGGNGMYLMPGQFLQYTWGCYVLDTERQTLSAYSFYGNSAKPELRLIASRGIAADRQFTNYNTGPDPEEIKKWIQMSQQPLRGKAQPGPANDKVEQPVEK